MLSTAVLELSQKNKKKIFDYFYRSENTRAQTEGYGLGLSIVKAICDQLQIKLSLSSKLGRGSIFRITLSVHEAEQAKIFKQNRKKLKTIQKLSGTVVLIEDNTPVRDSLKALIESWGAQVIASDSLNEALEESIRKSDKIDAVISDFNLGEGQATGLECILKLSLIQSQRLPSVLLTAVSSEIIEKHYIRTLRVLGEREAALFAMPRILQKPVSGETLNAMLAELMEENIH